MFGIFGRNQKPEPPSLTTSSAAWLQGSAAPAADCPSTPEEQVDLVCRTMEQLNLVQKMVRELPEVPAGDRQQLLDRLSATTDSLTSLTFLDAIY